MPLFLYDVTLTTTIRVDAPNAARAQRAIRALFADHEANLGQINGEPVIAELTIEGDLDLVEVDGEVIP